MEVFKVKFINTENKEQTVVTVVHTNAAGAILFAESFLDKMGFTHNKDKQEITCQKIQTQTPEIISFILP